MLKKNRSHLHEFYSLSAKGMKTKCKRLEVARSHDNDHHDDIHDNVCQVAAGDYGDDDDSH